MPRPGARSVLFRALFLPIWSLAVAIATILRLPRPTRAAIAALAVPIVLGALVILKNGVLFGVWTSSSWYGHNVARVAQRATLGEVPHLARNAVVSEIFGVGPFRPVRRYPTAVVESAAARAHTLYGSIPALTREISQDGWPNYNHLVYIDTSRQLAEDARAVYHNRPVLYREAVLTGLAWFHRPASRYFFVLLNRERVAWLDNLYLRVLYPNGTLLIVRTAVALTILTGALVWLVGRGEFAPLCAAGGYVAITIVWVLVASNLGESGENERFRFTIDPLMVTWLAVVAIAATRTVRSRASRL